MHMIVVVEEHAPCVPGACERAVLGVLVRTGKIDRVACVVMTAFVWGGDRDGRPGVPRNDPDRRSDGAASVGVGDGETRVVNADTVLVRHHGAGHGRSAVTRAPRRGQRLTVSNVGRRSVEHRGEQCGPAVRDRRALGDRLQVRPGPVRDAPDPPRDLRRVVERSVRTELNIDGALQSGRPGLDRDRSVGGVQPHAKQEVPHPVAEEIVAGVLRGEVARPRVIAAGHRRALGGVGVRVDRIDVSGETAGRGAFHVRPAEVSTRNGDVDLLERLGADVAYKKVGNSRRAGLDVESKGIAEPEGPNARVASAEEIGVSRRGRAVAIDVEDLSP